MAIKQKYEKKAKARVIVSFRMNPDVHECIMLLGKKDKRSISYLINQILEDHYENDLKDIHGELKDWHVKNKIKLTGSLL